MSAQILGFDSIEEFFTGQQIITQGELGETYFVLRRGKCAVYVRNPSAGFVQSAKTEYQN
jgi:hypothetical protein